MDFSKLKSLTIPEGNVTQIAVGGNVIWQSSPLPSAYQQVEWIRNTATSSTSGQHLDLGFPFDTAATIHLNYIAETASGQPFGAAENSGKLRCMISFASNFSFYGSNGSSYLNAATSGVDFTGKEVNIIFTLKKGALFGEDTISGVKTKTITTQAEYTMTRNLVLFAQNYNTAVRYNGQHKVKSFQYYDKNDTLICDLIPCYRKSDGVIGMYDIVRKIFLTNAGSGSFTKGADV